jgi:hypothetical protein
MVALFLGGAAALLSLMTGSIPSGAKLIAAVLGVVTTTAGAIGAYFQAGHFDAIALKYRETADVLDLLKLDMMSALTPESRGELVSNAEALMQAENAAWLLEVTPKPEPNS